MVGSNTMKMRIRIWKESTLKDKIKNSNEVDKWIYL